MLENSFFVVYIICKEKYEDASKRDEVDERFMK